MKYLPIIAAFLLSFISCSGSDDNEAPQNIPTVPAARTINYLALGDSYTIGQSVCETCRFPFQLKETLAAAINANYNLRIIAQTGWTTADLKAAIAAANPPNNFDLVTLLIGVNNQYQHQPFAVYEQEFPELLGMAVTMAKGDKTRVIVVSIPDYAYTPYGQSTTYPAGITEEINHYNAFAENYAALQGIKFVNITDITRQGLADPALVASDRLHPSQLAYSKFVERLFPVAKTILQE